MKNISKIIQIAMLVTAVTLPGVALAEQLPSFERASFGSVVLSDSQTFDSDTELELSIGNYQNEPIVNYSESSVFSKMGRSVGRLDTLTDVKIFPCTAFIVSEKHILTNYHCSVGLLKNPSTKATRIDAMQFVAGYLRTGVAENTRKYTVIPTPVEASAELDYALHEVLGNPSLDFGLLSVSRDKPNNNDPFWIIGHPLGEAQRISREQCKASSPAVSGGRLLHTCDTLPGNSGSPVIDASTQKVIALHHAGSRQDEVNFAILMASIVDKSPILLASLQEEINPSETTTDATPKLAQCDVLYDAAVKANQCFAYKAYSNSCSAHALAPIAKEYIQTFCKTEVTSAPAEKTDKEEQAYENLVEINDLRHLPVDERLTLINDFISKYPNSKRMPNVQYMLGLNLGMKRDLKASAKVFLYNYKKYPNSDVSSLSLYELAATLILLEQNEAGCDLLRRIKIQHPEAREVISDAEYIRKGECQ